MARTMKPCVVALASSIDWTSVVTHFDAAYSRSSHAVVVSTTVYCGQSMPWQNLRSTRPGSAETGRELTYWH